MIAVMVMVMIMIIIMIIAGNSITNLKLAFSEKTKCALQFVFLSLYLSLVISTFANELWLLTKNGFCLDF